MLATPDSDTGLASGVNNAVARAAGLIAVAAVGAVASLVFASVLGANMSGIEFGARPAAPLEAGVEMLRIAATNNAFQAIAWVSALVLLIASIIAWTTQPSWERKQDRD